MTHPFSRVVTARLFVAIWMAALTPVLASAQPARAQNPPDIAGEWSLANNEYDTTAQPPLGDYTGIAFNAAGVMRSETTAESTHKLVRAMRAGLNMFSTVAASSEPAGAGTPMG